MINIISPINQLGYGVTGLNIVKSLNQIADIALWVLGQPQVTTQEDADVIRSCIQKGQLPDFDAPCIKIWHQHDMTQFIGRGKRIGFPIFELDTFNKIEKHHLSSLDMIFVCSSWAKDVILNNISISEENVCVIPLGVDSSIFQPSPIPDSKVTRFFNCGKWEIRKGHDILVEAFNNSFNKDDSVELWMMCENPFCTEQEQQDWQNLYLQSKLGSKIRIIPRQATQKEVYNIMSQTHCGVFPSRAEGWNLELLEMMACGKSVITTAYSAHNEFCNSNNSYLIPIDDQELAYDGKWFHGQGQWAKIDNTQMSSISNHMQNIHQLRLNNQLTLNQNGINTASKYSWNNTATEIIKHVL
jgi:glycosyltransferase involved in cell wall biosynthesis